MFFQENEKDLRTTDYGLFISLISSINGTVHVLFDTLLPYTAD